MNIIVAGLSHKTAPIEIREKLAFSQENLNHFLVKLLQHTDIEEGIILSTCNRVEVVFSAQDKDPAIESAKRFLAETNNLTVEEIEPFLYLYVDTEAIRHVFRVASSLDSMIVGEPQILGQLKDAYRSAVECNATGSVLNRFLHKAFSVAKRVRTETAIAASAVSVSFAAVELARKIFEKMENKKILLIGAGEMAELVTKHLFSHGIRDICIANRTYDRAFQLASQFGGTALDLNDVPGYLPQADIVISSISAASYVISQEEAAHALKTRRNRPIFMVDISVPRTVDPQVNNLDNAYLYDIDDLQGIVEENKERRKAEAFKAEEIIESEIGSFAHWLHQQEVTPAIIQLRRKMERIRRQELEKTLAKWPELSENEKNALESLTASIVNKILHDPIAHLKSDSLKSGPSVDEIRKLFNIPEEDS